MLCLLSISIKGQIIQRFFSLIDKIQGEISGSSSILSLHGLSPLKLHGETQHMIREDLVEEQLFVNYVNQY